MSAAPEHGSDQLSLCVPAERSAPACSTRAVYCPWRSARALSARTLWPTSDPTSNHRRAARSPLHGAIALRRTAMS